MLLFFVIVAAAPLRLLLPLVYATTVGVLAAALIVLGQYAFIRVPGELKVSYFDLPPGDPHRIPRVSELIFLLALGAVGLLGGQVVRQAQRLVQG